MRRITNRFTGKLGMNISSELFLRGAQVKLIQGDSGYSVPAYLPVKIASTYDEYRAFVKAELSQKPYHFGIFSAAVADYKPEIVFPGKIPSGGVLQTIKLVPTVKVIDEVKDNFPDLYMVTFKYEEGVSHDELLAIALAKIQRGYPTIVANRGEETGVNGEQIAYLITAEEISQPLVGKQNIAIAIANHLEKIWHLRQAN